MPTETYINPPAMVTGVAWTRGTRVFEASGAPVNVLNRATLPSRQYTIIGPSIGSPSTEDLATYVGASVDSICAYLDARVLATAQPNGYGVSQRWWRLWLDPADSNKEYRVVDSKYVYDIITAL